MQSFHATTILAVRKGEDIAIAGDGQVSLGDTIAKADAVKVRRFRRGDAPTSGGRAQGSNNKR